MRLFWQKARSRNAVCEHKQTIRTRSGNVAEPNVVRCFSGTANESGEAGSWRLVCQRWDESMKSANTSKLAQSIPSARHDDPFTGRFLQSFFFVFCFFAHRVEWSGLAFCLSLFWKWYMCSNWSRIPSSLLLLLSKEKKKRFGHLGLSLKMNYLEMCRFTGFCLPCHFLLI